MHHLDLIKIISKTCTAIADSAQKDYRNDIAHIRTHAHWGVFLNAFYKIDVGAVETMGHLIADGTHDMMYLRKRRQKNERRNISLSE